MDPFTAMMIFKAGKTIMDQQASVAAANARNVAKYKRDLGIKKRLETQAGFARQSLADTNKMRQRNLDIKADAGIESRLNEMRIAGSLKALGKPAGQSTAMLSRQGIAEILKGESKFLKDMEMKTAQLQYRDREIQQGMDMAFLDAQAQIAGRSYQGGPSNMNLAMGFVGGAMDAYSYDKQMGGEWS